MLGRPTPRSGLLSGRLDGLQSVGHDHPTNDILPITGAFFSLRRTPSMAAPQNPFAQRRTAERRACGREQARNATYRRLSSGGRMNGGARQRSPLPGE